MDPLFALAALAADVEHVDAELANLEARLEDAGGARARAENVGLGGAVAGLDDPGHGLEEAVRG